MIKGNHFFNSGLITIGDEVFTFNCITRLDLPPALVNIGEHAFLDNDISSLTIAHADSINLAGKRAFKNNSLTSLILMEGVTRIGESLFAGNKLTELTLPSSIQSF